MIARIPPEISQIASANPSVSHHTCFWCTTLSAVLLMTLKAAGETCGFRFFAMSLHTESRWRNPISAKPNSRNGTTAVAIWNASALAQVSRLRSLNELTSSRRAAGSSARGEGQVAVAIYGVVPIAGTVYVPGSTTGADPPAGCAADPPAGCAAAL